MRTPNLPGAVVPTYSSVYEQVRIGIESNPIIASTSVLIPMVFFDDNAPVEEPTVRLISTEGNQSFEIDGTLFTQYTIDNTQCWYLWENTQVGITIPPGKYYIDFLAGSRQFTEELMLCDLCTNFTPKLFLDQINPGSPNRFIVSSVDQGNATIINQSIGVIENGNTSQVTFNDLEAEIVQTVSQPNITIINIFRKVETVCGVFTAYYALSFDPTDAARTAVLDLTNIDYNPVEDAKDIWYLEFGNSTDSNNIPYQFGFTQRYYFKPAYNNPTVEDDNNYIANGDGDRYFEDALLRENVTIEFFGVIDPVMLALAWSAHLDNKKLVNSVTGYEINLNYYEIAFTPDASRKHNAAVLTYNRANISHRSYGENMALITP